MRYLILIVLACSPNLCYWHTDCQLGDGGWPPCSHQWQDGDGGWHTMRPECREGVCIMECSP